MKKDPELLQIKEQLKFEKEVFYWSNIRSFEYDYDQSHYKSVEELRNKWYNLPYHLDEHNNITRAWNIENPFAYPSQEHYRYWCNSRDDYYYTHNSEDQYWDIETNYYKELIFAAPWTRFVDDWKYGTIPDDLDLRGALECARNPDSATFHYPVGIN